MAEARDPRETTSDGERPAIDRIAAEHSPSFLPPAHRGNISIPAVFSDTGAVAATAAQAAIT